MSMQNVIESLRRGEVPYENLDRIIVDRNDIVKAFNEDLDYLNNVGAFKTR